MRQGKNIVEVAARQEFRCPVIEPLFLNHGLAFRTMPITTGVVDITLQAAMIALLFMTAEFGGSTNFNMVNYLGLLAGHR